MGEIDVGGLLFWLLAYLVVAPRRPTWSLRAVLPRVPRTDP